MKLRTKRPEWKSLVPLQLSRLSRKSAMRFFLFPKVQSAGQSPDDTPVYLNVYDLTPMNGYIYWAGLGIFHSGIEGSFSLPYVSIFFPVNT
ncbi:DeSI-like protein [Zea mays]|jgi:deubiquitinase DESI2|nr:DeSI-like protein [Zea mays]